MSDFQEHIAIIVVVVTIVGVVLAPIFSGLRQIQRILADDHVHRSEVELLRQQLTSDLRDVHSRHERLLERLAWLERNHLPPNSEP